MSSPELLADCEQRLTVEDMAGKRWHQRLARWFLRRLASPYGPVILLGFWLYGVPVQVITVLSGAALIYYLFFNRHPCGALNSDDKTFCKRNADGLFGGCGIADHEAQNRRRLRHPLSARPPRPTAAPPPRVAVTGTAAFAVPAPAAPVAGSGFWTGRVLPFADTLFTFLSFIVGILAWRLPVR